MSKEFDERVTNFFKNYHDRGMKKWGGFFLSDHRMAINSANKDRGQTYAKKSKMTQEEISEVLLKSYSEHYQVSLQLKDLDGDGNYKADIVGFVKGWAGQELIIDDQLIEMDNINHAMIV
ncbi:hypothetical protein [uncultured Lactobacillus sp.]|uniref:hypothetical protein n=1 Tax=uncultured Lactobacillus sp. TaxID=153152 RepID=UPI00259BB5E4|nr:hypothetical protein [uncultured Lactobacillus sp.]